MAGRGSKSSRGILPNVRTYKLRSNISGMVQNRAEAFLSTDQAVDILNMHATEEGSWTAHNAGYTKINSGGTAYESGAAVDGMAWFVDSSLADHLFIAINGKLKEINTATGEASDIDASAGYTVGNAVDFEALNDVLYTVDGSIAAPRRWNGALAETATGWPITLANGDTFSKPRYIESHQNHMVYLNFQGGGGSASKYPSHFAVSDLDNPESFTLVGVGADGAYIGEAGSGDGQEIVGARSMHVPASNQSQLVIFKTRSTYLMKGNSSQASDADVFTVVKINGNYGAINNRCIVQVGNDLLALNEFGVSALSADTQSGDIQPNPINSDLVKDVIGRLNLNAKSKCWGIHLPNRREVWFFMPTGASTQCNEAIVYKYLAPGVTDQLPKWSRRLDSGSKFKCAHGCLLNRTFYIGTYSGVVGTMFTASKYDNVGIPWKYEFPYWDAGNEKQIKRFLNGDMHFKLHSSQTVTMTTKWKGGNNNDQQSVAIPVDTTVAGAEYGTAVYGVAYYGEQEELKVQYSAPGNGLRLKHTLSGTTNDSGPEFLGLTPVLELGGLSQMWN